MPHATHWPCGEKLPPSKGKPNSVPQVRNEETQPTRPLMPRTFRRASSAHLYGRWPFPAQACGSPRWNFVRPTGAMQPGSGEQPNEPQAPPDSWAAASGRSSLPSHPVMSPRLSGCLYPATEDQDLYAIMIQLIYTFSSLLRLFQLGALGSVLKSQWQRLYGTSSVRPLTSCENLGKLLCFSLLHLPPSNLVDPQEEKGPDNDGIYFQCLELCLM